MPENKYLLWFLIIIGLCGVLIFSAKNRSVFPSASIDLSVPKADILKMAEDWATKYGYKKDNMIKSITFDVDDSAKTFLEYELGNAAANQLMKEQIPTFYWNCAFKKEFDQEKMEVTLTTQGKLNYLEHTFPNDRAIRSIDHKQALDRAFGFVLRHTGWLASDCKLVKDDTISQLHRQDYAFTWEYQKLDWHGAKLRANANVAGNVLSLYNEYLKLPEEWSRKYNTIRSYNSLLQTIAEIFYFPLYLAAIFIFFRGMSVKDIRWRFVLPCAAILTTICLLDDLNNLQDKLSSYDPQQSYISFLCTTIFFMLASLPFIFMLVTIMAATAERVYRSTFPAHLPIDKWFSSSALRSRYVRLGLLVGYVACGISLGYQICYYALGEKIHFWCPMGVDNYQILTATFPWFSACSLGIFASASEECLYRVLMLGLGQKLFKNFWLANVLQAMAWGFMHSNYPQLPAYARGIELSIEGIFWGWILRRYGLLPCLVSHYLFDATCEVIPLLSAPILGLKASALIPLLPLLILGIAGWILRIKKGVPEEDEGTISGGAPGLTGATALASTVPGATTPESTAPGLIASASPAEDKLEYTPLPKSTRLIIAAVASVLLLISLFWHPPAYEIYQHPVKLKVNRQEAINIARDYLLQNKFDLTGYMSSAMLMDGLRWHSEEFQYMFEQIGFKPTDAIAHAIEDAHLWDVRFFKPGEGQEYVVDIDHLGNVRAPTIIKLEDAPGASLSESEARKIAEDALQRYRRVYEPLVFENAEVKNRAHRIDYMFKFKSPKYKVGDANLMVTFAVVGDKAAGASHYWKLPDDWRWNRSKITLEKTVVFIILSALGIGIFFVWVWWIVSLFRGNYVHWRPALIPAGIFLGALCVLLCNLSVCGLQSYRTTIPLPSFITIVIAGILVVVVVSTAIMIFAFTTAWAGIEQLRFTNQTLTALKCLIPWLPAEKAKVQFNMWLDAILLAGAYGLLASLLSSVALSIGRQFSHSVLLNNFSSFDMAVNSFSPCLTEVSMQICVLLFSIVSIASGIAMLVKFGINKNWRIFMFILLANLVAATSVLVSQEKFYWPEYLFTVVLGLGSSLLFWAFLQMAVRRNALSLVVLLFLASVLGNLKAFIGCGWPLYRADTAAMVALALVPVAYLVYARLRANSAVARQ